MSVPRVDGLVVRFRAGALLVRFRQTLTADLEGDRWHVHSPDGCHGYGAHVDEAASDWLRARFSAPSGAATSDGPTYELVTGEYGSAGIKCLRCGLVSYHPRDVAERYCGNCHAWHDPIPDWAKQNAHVEETPPWR